MNILVIGGLGYLGSIISDMMSNRCNRVTIVDSCMYENDDVEADIRAYKIIKGDVCCSHISSLILENDAIIWCADVDIELFHTCDEFVQYMTKMREVFAEIAKTGKMWYISSSVLDGQSDNKPSFSDYVRWCEKQQCKIIRIGNLYGPSPRMRWDTPLNVLMFTALTESEISVGGNVFKKMPVNYVTSTAEFICQRVTDNDKDFCTYYETTMSTIEAAHFLANEMKGMGQQRSVSADEIDFLDSEDFDSELTIGKNLIETAFKQTIQGLQNNMLPDWMNDKYFNCAVIDTILSAKRFAKHAGGLLNG